MYTLKDFSAGDAVCLRRIGEALRYVKPGETPLLSGTVVAVGRKYVSVRVGNNAIVKFEENPAARTGMQHSTKYSQEYVLYKTQKEAEDELRQINLRKQIERKLRRYDWARGLSMADLETIADILRVSEDVDQE